MRARNDEKLIHENGFSLLATFFVASPLRRRAFERFSACLLVFGRFDGKLCWKENKNLLTKFTWVEFLGIKQKCSGGSDFGRKSTYLLSPRPCVVFQRQIRTSRQTGSNKLLVETPAFMFTHTKGSLKDSRKEILRQPATKKPIRSESKPFKNKFNSMFRSNGIPSGKSAPKMLIKRLLVHFSHKFIFCSFAPAVFQLFFHVN